MNQLFLFKKKNPLSKKMKINIQIFDTFLNIIIHLLKEIFCPFQIVPYNSLCSKLYHILYTFIKIRIFDLNKLYKIT